MTKFYISDLHIGHQRCLVFDKRPFENLDEMHEEIVRRWNSVVTKDDHVYILGDACWKNGVGLEVLKRLNGTKHLICGNHDRLNADLEECFASVRDYEVVKDGDEHVVLCHYPIAHWINADYGFIHLYGHIHAGRDNEVFQEYAKTMRKRETPYRCCNVGCMMPYMDYTPRTLEELKDRRLL